MNTTLLTQSAEDSTATLAKALDFAIGKLTLRDLLSALLLFLLCYALSRVLRRFISKGVERLKISVSLKRFFMQLLRFSLDFIILLIVADSLGLPITSLLAVFSLLGLAVSLSIQSLLSNLISGVVLLFNRPFDTGDYVEIKGVSGTVKQIALFQTQLNTIDNKLVYLPNSDVAASTIVNYSAEGTRRLDLTFGAGYDCPVESVKAAILECAASVPGVLGDPAPAVVVSSFEESNVNYTVRLWVRSGDYIAVCDAMNDRILACYEAHGVQMAYPHVVIRQ